jgi:hypothetical protein
MKNNIIIGAALFIISLSNSVAQNDPAANASASQGFEKTFKGALNVKWTACEKKISLVQFKFMDKAWLAYFDHTGKLLTSGRRVSIPELPVIVQTGMYSTKERFEKKNGALTLGLIYEMVTDGVTEYYVPLKNTKIFLMIAVRTDGAVVIKSRKKSSEQSKSPQDIIARKD